MKAALKVLLVWSFIAIALVVVVFYRYDLIGGIKKSMEESPGQNKEAPAVALTLTPAQLNGQKLYKEKTCVLCHGDNGKADTPAGKGINATNLTEGKFHNNKNNLEAKAYILQVIENGVPGTAMAEFKSQIPAEQDRKDLADYVHTFAAK